MKTPQHIIDLLRELIVSYYDGTISPADFDRLVGLLATVDSKSLPSDLAEDASLIRLLGSGAQAVMTDVPDDLEGRIKAITSGNTGKRKFVFVLRRIVPPVAAAAIATLIFMTMNPTEPAEIVLTPEPTIFVRLAAQQDVELTNFEDEVDGTRNDLIASASRPAAVEIVEEEIPDNYIEITNLEQASILTQDAMSLVREKLAVAGYSIGSASESFRQIDTTIRDIISN